MTQDKSFNGLTNAEAERLAMLAEEAGEIIQAVGKILRHGYQSTHPLDLHGPNNRDMLQEEIKELVAIASHMDECGDILFAISTPFHNHWKKKLKYTHHQGWSP
jgi:NTP pyrophosphatase (non-canonical NTP hydrolase)